MVFTSARRLRHFCWDSACHLMPSGGWTHRELKPTSCPVPSTAYSCLGLGPWDPLSSAGLLNDYVSNRVLYKVRHTPVTGRNRLSRDDGRRMSARNLKRSSSLSRSASCQIQVPHGKGAESPQIRWGPSGKNLCAPFRPSPLSYTKVTCLKKLVTVNVAGRKLEKLQASSPL